MKTSRKLPRVEITKIGLWFVLFTFVIAVAATNTGNNSLYMVVATMISLVIISVVAGWLNVRGLVIGEIEAREIFVGRTNELRLKLANRSRWLPRWLVQVSVEPESPDGQGPDRQKPPDSPLEADQGRAGRGALVPHLIRRRRGRLAWSDASQPVEFVRRGRVTLSGTVLSTLFPFGLFRISRVVTSERGLLVYPALIQGLDLEQELPGHLGDNASRRAGFGTELFSLRDMRPGEDPRGIHWKQTARTGRFIYKQRAADDGRRVSLVLDNALPAGAGAEHHARFERAVSEAATVALEYLEQDFEVELLTRDSVVPYCSGIVGRELILEKLALVEALEPAVGEEYSPLSPDTGLSAVERRFGVSEAVTPSGASGHAAEPGEKRHRTAARRAGRSSSGGAGRKPRVATS